MGPKFRAAEQSLQTEFQIFPVSLERLGQEMAVDTFLFLTVFVLCQLPHPGTVAAAKCLPSTRSVTGTGDASGL